MNDIRSNNKPDENNDREKIMKTIKRVESDVFELDDI